MDMDHTPYKCHLFVCTNSRDGVRKSCGDAGSGELKRVLKEEISDRGWKGTVRVSTSGCLGVCDTGPNIMLYPQQLLFSGVQQSDLPEILYRVEEILNAGS